MQLMFNFIASCSLEFGNSPAGAAGPLRAAALGHQDGAVAMWSAG